MKAKIIKDNKGNIEGIKMDLKAEAILEKEVTQSGTGGHIIVPNKYVGKKATIIINKT